ERGPRLGHGQGSRRRLRPRVPGPRPARAEGRRRRVATLRGDAVSEIPETRYAKSGDVSIAYQVVGDGPFDVVLVPSWSHVERAWTMPNHHGQIPRRLVSFARLIVFDKRGTGMSDRVAAELPETRMDDVRAAMDAAGSSRAALFGFADGVPLSLLFAATYPKRVSALVLQSGFARGMWAADYPWGSTEEELRATLETLLAIFGPRAEAIEPMRAFWGSEPSDDAIL